MKLKPDESKRRLHGRLFARRNAPNHDFLLTNRDFRFAADCERMRVDRNGSVLSLLLIRLPRSKSTAEDVEFLARVLEGRLRVTDTPGLLDDGRIGVLLPDTPPEGAWKVATDISEVYPPGPERPECDVLVYPPHRRGATTATSAEADEDEPVRVAGGSAPKSESSEFFFAKRMPPWKRGIDVAGASVGLVVGGADHVGGRGGDQADVAGSGVLRAGARRPRRTPVSNLEAADDVRRRRGAEGATARPEPAGRPGVQDAARSADDAARPLPAVVEHRRAAAVLECAAGRHVARRPAAAADRRSRRRATAGSGGGWTFARA